MKAELQQHGGGKIFTVLKKFKSIVWKYFGFYKKDGKLDKTRIICKECRASKPHLKKHDIDVMSKAATGAQEANSNTGENDKITSYYGNNSKTTTLAASSTHVKVITEAISFSFKDIQPYSVVEDEGFKNLVKTLEPRYTIPDRAAKSPLCTTKWK